MTLPPEEELLRRFIPDPQSGQMPINAFRPTPADIGNFCFMSSITESDPKGSQ
jgi:hypothetical protein